MLVDFDYAQASVDHNIRGIASSSAGYISFNCLDDDFFGKFTMTFPFYFNVPPCSVSQHGVNLDDYNNLSGSAWSPSLGYLDFGSESAPNAPDYGFNSHCLNQCTSANHCHACYNYNTERFYGWAYYAANNEWIRLDEPANVPSGSYFMPVRMANVNSPQPGVLHGYIHPSFGPLSFNCEDESTCGINPYKVFMWKLELQSMSAPNWSFSQACSSNARRVVFQWLKKSGIQSAYRIIVSTSNSTSSPVFDTGKKTSSAYQLVCPSADCLWTPEYNTSYYWWLQLWNDLDEPTEMFQFNRDINGFLTDNIAYNDAVSPNNRLTFTSYRHEFPNPFFSWDPPEILVGSSTQFVSDAKFYTNAQPDSNPQTCVDGNCDFLWSVSNPDEAIIDSPTSANTDIIFKNIYPQDVTLRVTDAEGYQCSRAYSVLTINFQLPLWKEVKAE